MPCLEWSILAQGFSIDRTTNSLSIFNAIEDILIPPDVADPEPGQQIAIGPSFVLLQLWSRETPDVPEVAEGRVTVVSPNQSEMGAGTFTIDLEPSARTRTITALPFLPYVGPGIYRLVIDIKMGESWQKFSEINLSVVKQITAQTQGANK